MIKRTAACVRYPGRLMLQVKAARPDYAKTSLVFWKVAAAHLGYLTMSLL